MNPQPRFLQGLFPFEGRGLDHPFLLAAELNYVVPKEQRAQLVYFRAGNSSDQLIYVLVMRDGVPMRYFPIGARAHVHVPLAVVEDLLTETSLEVFLGAPKGLLGSVVLDIGLIEV